MTRLRVASWPPWYAPNRYVELFHAALAPHGIDHVPGLPLDARELARHRIHVAHLHWVEWAWQSRGRTSWAQRRGVRALDRFLEEAERRGIAVAWTVHNLVAHEPGGAGDLEGFGLVHQRAALRIFHSEHARQEALRTFGELGDTLVMPMGRYDDVLPSPRPREAVRASLGIPADAPLLACIGNVRPYKGVDLALGALQEAGCEDVHLTVAGRCRDAALARDLAARAARTPRVRLHLSLVDDQRIADLLHAADAALLPYREVTGSAALMAACSAGRGVVATDLPYFREALAPEPDAGVLAATPSPSDLAAAIGAFLADDVAARGAAARRLADRCSWDRVVVPVADWFRAHVAR